MNGSARSLARLATLVAAFALPAAAAAQSSPSPYTSASRYDLAGHVTGTISADPDGVGAGNPFLATRTTYDIRGNAIKVESGSLSTWQSEATAPSAWSGFTAYTTTEIAYDGLDRKVTVQVKGSDLVAVSLTQYSYDSVGRLECTAVRMNPAAYGSLPAACTQGSAGSYGPDRITKNVYDNAGQLVQVREGVGSADEGSEVTYSYTANGKKQYVIDANGNRAQLTYDGHDRQASWIFPSATRPGSFNDSTQANALATAGSVNSADHEDYTYDANGNRLTLRKRDGSTLTYTYDFLDRMTVKTVPERSGLSSTHTRDVYYEYDARGLQTKARFDSLSGEGDTFAYDGFGRTTSASETMDGATRQLTFPTYDKDGNRTSIGFPDGPTFAYQYDGLDRFARVVAPAGTWLSIDWYDAAGRLYLDERYDYAPDLHLGYDPAGRQSSHSINQFNSAQYVTWTLNRNPASQVTTEARDNDAYAKTGQAAVSPAYTTNGLNQYTAAGTAAFCYDANGNLTADGSSVYLYDVENRLVEMRVQTNSTCSSLSYSGTIQAALRYEPQGRLHEVLGYAAGVLTGTTRFLYDGDAMVAEYDAGGTMLARYVHGASPGVDDPLVSYSGSSTALGNVRFLFRDMRGSIALRSDTAGSSTAINTYDEYGIPGAGNVGRFQYTGQAWLPEIGMYYYKARIYSPTLGRFLQTDPIGYDDQFNLYAYVGDDPVNGLDPSGEATDGSGTPPGQACTGSLTTVCGVSPSSNPGTLGVQTAHESGQVGYDSARQLSAAAQESRTGEALRKDVQEGVDASKDFQKNYADMRRANTIGGDKYFHCKANCEAASRGKVGQFVATRISNGREIADQRIKGDPRSASLADQAANHQGRAAGTAAANANPNRSSAEKICRAECDSLRPNGLPPQY